MDQLSMIDKDEVGLAGFIRVFGGNLEDKLRKDFGEGNTHVGFSYLNTEGRVAEVSFSLRELSYRLQGSLVLETEGEEVNIASPRGLQIYHESTGSIPTVTPAKLREAARFSELVTQYLRETCEPCGTRHGGVPLYKTTMSSHHRTDDSSAGTACHNLVS